MQRVPPGPLLGFTLVEVIVLIGVTTLVTGALTSIIVNFYRTNGYLVEETSALDSIRRGVKLSFEELRQAAYGEDGAFPLASAATSSVTFYSDVDNDGTVERIRLYLEGITLYRGVTEAAGSPLSYAGQPEAVSVVAPYVKNPTSTPIFRYYDRSGAEMSAPSIDVSQVSSISTELQVDLNPTRAPDILTLEETATLRNLRP